MGRHKGSKNVVASVATAPAAPAEAKTQVGSGAGAYRGVTLDAVPQTPTAQMFPDEPEETTEVVEPAPEAAPTTETPKAEEPTVEKTQEEVDLEEFAKKYGDKKKKFDVDGKVLEVPLSEVFTAYETRQKLAERGREVGSLRKQMAEERKMLEQLRQSIAAQGPDSQENALRDDPAPRGAEAELMQLKQQFAALQENLAPITHQTARQRLDEELKADGFQDFNDYLPRMDAYVAGVQDEAKFHYFNTPEGARALYLDMKLKDTLKAKSQPAPEPPKQETPEKRPPIVKIDGGAPSPTGIVDDRAAKYREAFMAWQANPGDRNLLSAVLRLKGL
jgi:hypothetical protein